MKLSRLFKYIPISVLRMLGEGSNLRLMAYFLIQSLGGVPGFFLSQGGFLI